MPFAVQVCMYVHNHVDFIVFTRATLQNSSKSILWATKNRPFATTRSYSPRGKNAAMIL